jgi:methylated-DNA-protein-cysteine methyltransferase related protein
MSIESPTDRDAAVLEAVRAIPAGSVRTYGEVSPGAPRRAGQLLKTVHAPDVPWWRVVRADGTLAAGAEQERRLRQEGVPFRGTDPIRVDFSAL